MYKRKIVELLALYELEPDLKQVWVEGTTDRSFFRWYLSEKGLDTVNVEAIDQVEVPTDLLKKYGLTSSNRNRSIALALEIEAGLQGREEYATLLFVVDWDFDDYLARRINGKFPAYTDFTALEMYLFDEDVISKLIRLLTTTPDRSVGELMSRLTCVGSELFSVRTANEVLGWGMKVPDPTKLLSNTKSSIEFDMTTFVERTLQANSRCCSSDEFSGAVACCVEMMPDEPRCGIRGHDFLDLLHWAIKKDIRPKEAGKSADLLAKFMLMGADASNFSEFDLFSIIEEVLGSQKHDFEGDGAEI